MPKKRLRALKENKLFGLGALLDEIAETFSEENKRTTEIRFEETEKKLTIACIYSMSELFL